MKFSVLQLNVERSRHVESVTKLLRKKKPDIACFQEAMFKDVKKMAADLGYELAFAPRLSMKDGSGIDQEGSAIISRLPIKRTQEYRYDNFRLPEIPVYTEAEIASHSGKRPKIRLRYNVLTVSVQPESGRELTVATTHFPVADHETPGMGDHKFQDTDELRAVLLSSEYLDRILPILNSLSWPLVFTGDLNNDRREYLYDRIAQDFLDIIPASVTSTLDPKLHRKPWLELAVDAFMVSPQFKVNNFKIIEGVSDHKALLASLSLKTSSKSSIFGIFTKKDKKW